MASHRIRAAALGFLATALIGGTVACSSSQTSEPTASPDHDTFSKCLTDNGVPAPPQGGPGGPGGPGGHDGPPPEGPPPSGPPPNGTGSAGSPPAPPGVDQATWEKAMQQCASLAPAPPQL